MRHNFKTKSTVSFSLFRLFPESAEYIDKIPVDSMLGIPLDMQHHYILRKDDFLKRSKAIEANAAITTDYFIERLESLHENVLRPVFNLKESIIRYEFQHRGAIHAHCLHAYPNGPSVPEMELCFDTSKMPTYDVQAQLDKYTKIVHRPDFLNRNEEDRLYFQKQIIHNEQNLKLIESISSAKSKAKNFFVNELGISELHSSMNPNSWKPPYGNNFVEPIQNVLRQTLEQKMDSDELLQLSHQRLLNRVQTHSCTYK